MRKGTLIYQSTRHVLFHNQSSDDVEEAVTKNDVEENVGSFRLVKGLNRFCLSHPGVYNLMPRSDCHQFAQDVYQFKTSSSFPTLRITAVRHALNAEIHADVETSGQFPNLDI